MLEFFIISSLINAFIFALMGFFVLLNNRKKKNNILYFFFCFAVVGWSISYALWLKSVNEENALFWTRMLNFFAIFIPLFFCHWVFNLLGLDKKKGHKIFLFLVYSAAAFFSAFAFHPYYVARVEPKLFFPFWPMPGKIHPYYLITLWGMALTYSWWSFYKRLKTSFGSQKTQIKYILISLPIGFGGGFTNFFLWYGIPFPPYFNVFVSVWGLSFLYIVFRYSFMEIRSVLSRAVIYIFAFSPVALLCFAFSYLLQFIGSNFAVFFLAAGLGISSILLYSRSICFFEKIASRYFYNSFYALKEKVSFFSEKINQMIEIEKLSFYVISSLKQALKMEKAAIVLKDSEKEKFFIKKQEGLDGEKINSLLDLNSGFLLFWLKKSKKALLREKLDILPEKFKKEEKNIAQEKFGKIKEKMKEAGIEIAAPLLVENKLIGAIFLGEKTAGKIYSSQEVKLLESFAVQASVAFNNSLAYEELAKRKEELERFYNLTIGREVRMAELKEQIKKLEERNKII